VKERGNALGAAVRAAPVIETQRRKELAAFQKSAAIRFRSPELLNLSFIHRSASNENLAKANNERLEFLGDAILGAVTADILFGRLADRSEGDLAKVKSVVVSEESLAGIALGLRIDTLLILGKGEESSGGRMKKAILADAMEALIGAYYLDSGFDTAYAFVRRIMESEIESVLSNRHRKDYKTLLQELSQSLFHSYPTYRLLKRSGPDHDRIFWMEVVVEGRAFGPGTGRNKKDAEQSAARAAYEALASAELEPLT
jgi:ribonuclease-3